MVMIYTLVIIMMIAMVINANDGDVGGDDGFMVEVMIQW